MLIKCKYDALVNPKTLLPHPKNSNEHSGEQITRLAEILDYQGQRAPVVVSNLSKFIVKGHGTTLSAIKLNAKEIAVVYQDFENEDQEYAFLTSDNAIAEWSNLNLGKINEHIQFLGPELNLDMLGLKDFKIDPQITNNKQVSNSEQYIVSIICKNENEMADVFEEMKERGFECKLIT